MYWKQKSTNRIDAYMVEDRNKVLTELKRTLTWYKIKKKLID